MMTKINILKEEFGFIHRYSPIEHVNSRLKSPEYILRKAARKNCEPSFDGIRENILESRSPDQDDCDGLLGKSRTQDLLQVLARGT